MYVDMQYIISVFTVATVNLLALQFYMSSERVSIDLGSHVLNNKVTVKLEQVYQDTLLCVV